MRVYLFPILIASLLNYSLATFILVKNPRCIINKVFALLNLSIGIWNTGVFLMYTSSSYQEAVFFNKFVLTTGLVFLHSCFFHFVLVFTENKNKTNKKIMQIGYLLSFLSVISTGIGFPLLSQKLIKNYWGYYPKAGIGDLFFVIIFAFYVLYSLYLLHNACKKSNSYHSNQIKYVFWGSFIAIIGGSTNFLSVFGLSIYPLGYISNCIYSLIITYAIIEFRLLDIHIVFKKGLVYSCWLFFVGLSYVSIISLIKEMTHTHKIEDPYILILAAILSFLMVFFFLRKILENLLNKIIFKNKYNYQIIIKDFTASLLTILETEELIPLIVSTIYKTMHLTSCSLILYDPTKNSYALKHLEGLKKNNEFGEIQLNSQNKLVQYFNKHNFILLQDELKRNIFYNKKDEKLKQLHQSLLYIQSKVCIPLYVNNKLIGLLNLGNKQSGDLFNREDLKLLTTLANQSAIAISNAQSIEKIKKQQERIAKNEQLAVIGQLSNEMFHEINKSLTRINLNEQLLKKSIHKDQTKDLTVIEKEVKRVAKIVEGFSVFSQQNIPNKNLIHINKLIENSLDFLILQISKNKIKIIKQLDYTLPEIKINPIQIEQALINIIENSIQAMSSNKKTIRIKTSQTCFFPQESLFLTPTINIEITDTGNGIPKENIDKIFNPFYTTKEDQSCAGLGLGISSRIIEQHQGNIEIESKLHKGTKVTIQLPLTDELLYKQPFNHTLYENLRKKQKVNNLKNNQGK
ncbi:GAF domain-containing protein [bacterium]|nr:GAF domain-containing protein [bacterium]